ncbi:MAG: MerC domain-containing protein [Verrucomicrobiota bacterium]
MDHSHAESQSHGWLDKLAVSMAVICAVHCLLTPLLIVLLPIIATTFFVHQDFHLWMMFLVLPTTLIAVFMGCRKHRDRWVAVMSVLGLSVLLTALVLERRTPAAHTAAGAEVPHCEQCARDLSEEPIPLSAGAWLNTLGGVFLASAHVRNFRLCRKSRCSH